MSEEGALLFTVALFVVAIFIWWRLTGRWGALQVVIVMAVVASNVRWQWTPNPALATLIAIGVAWYITWGLSAAIDLAVRLKGKNTQG